MSEARTVTFKRTHSANRGNSSYQAPGQADGTIYLSKNAFGGNHPEELVVQGVPEPVTKEAKAAASTEAKEKAKAEKAAAREQAKAQKAAEKAKAKADALAAKAAEAAERAKALAESSASPASSQM